MSENSLRSVAGELRQQTPAVGERAQLVYQNGVWPLTAIETVKKIFETLSEFRESWSDCPGCDAPVGKHGAECLLGQAFNLAENGLKIAREAYSAMGQPDTPPTPREGQPLEEELPTCARCQQSKPTVSVHTGFAGESELLCGDCVFAEFNELEDKIEALEGRAAGQTSGDAHAPEPFRHEKDSEGCATCGHGDEWTVIYKPPDGSEEEGWSETWGNECPAEEMADSLNLAFGRGWRAALGQTSTAPGREESKHGS